jgi:predicted metallopeptidase
LQITYSPAEDVQLLVRDLIGSLSLTFIDPDRVLCFRSKGSKSRRIIARCYSLSKIWQKALYLPSFYIIEVISEHYDGLSEEERVKVMIHELMHIPKCFGGGLRPHSGCVTRKAVEENYRRYLAFKVSNRTLKAL